MGNRYADWFRQAEADLAHARNALAAGDYEWSCFAAQQAAEKATKAVFLHHIPTRYPNGFDAGAPTDFYTRSEARHAISCAARVLAFCRDQIG